MVQIVGILSTNGHMCIEHPGTRRCTIHPCTLTPTLTQNTTNHFIFVHIWISLATVCSVLCHRRADFERISCSERAPKRRSCRLKRRSFLRERRRPTRLQRCPGRSTCRWKVVIRTLELLGAIREFLEDFSENGVKSLHVVSHLQSLCRRDAGEVGAWIWRAHVEHATCFSSNCYVGPFLSHFSRHIPLRSGLPLHGQCTPRCCVARSLTRFLPPNDCILWVFERDSRCINFAILSSPSPFQETCHITPWLPLATKCT